MPALILILARRSSSVRCSCCGMARVVSCRGCLTLCHVLAAADLLTWCVRLHSVWAGGYVHDDHMIGDHSEYLVLGIVVVNCYIIWRVIRHNIIYEYNTVITTVPFSLLRVYIYGFRSTMKYYYLNNWEYICSFIGTSFPYYMQHKFSTFNSQSYDNWYITKLDIK